MANNFSDLKSLMPMTTVTVSPNATYLANGATAKNPLPGLQYIGDWKTLHVSLNLTSTNPNLVNTAVTVLIQWYYEPHGSAEFRLEQFVCPTPHLSTAPPYNVTNDIQTLNIPICAPWVFIFFNVCGQTQTFDAAFEVSNRDNIPITSPQYGMPYLSIAGAAVGAGFLLTANYLHIGELSLFATASYVAGASINIDIFEMGFDGNFSPPAQIDRIGFSLPGGSGFTENVLHRVACRHGPLRIQVTGSAAATVFFSANPVCN